MFFGYTWIEIPCEIPSIWTFFMSIRISKLKDWYISLYQAIYATYVAEKYLYTDTVKENSKFRKTTLPHDMIFNKENAYTSDE